MADTGWLAPGTISDDFTGGSVPCAGVADAATSNDVYATSSTDEPGNGTTRLRATNFGASIPAGATINGIEVGIEKSDPNAQGISDNVIQLFIGGAYTGENKAAGAWETSDTETIYGGATDKWGLTPTQAQVIASAFGVGLEATLTYVDNTSLAQVDRFRMKIYYTAAGGGGFFRFFLV